jgi:glycosyltransferase involved in cell wall biosynthesis
MSSKKSVLIYSEYWQSRGGGEKYLLTIVETLLRSHYDITIAAQTGMFDPQSLSQYFRLNVDGVKIHALDGGTDAVRSQAEAMSAQFDICIYITNFRFFDSRARQTFVILQVPYGKINFFSLTTKAIREGAKEAAKDYVRLQMFKRLHETQAVLVYSQFVREALEFVHDVPSTILAPAIDDFLIEGTQKERVILSVGRIFRGLYNDKRYDILIEAFKQLYKRLPNTTWQYRIVGSCGDDDASRKYLDELRTVASGFPIYFHINAPYDELQRHYNDATLFWHAAGFGIEEWETPQRAEHFGMSTLEAMSACAVPIVVHCGGQREIVSEGECGYLWSSIDELIERSITLMHNQSLLSQMQAKARERFGDFDREHFSEKLISILEP